MRASDTIRRFLLFYSSVMVCLSMQAQDATTESENSAGTGGDSSVPLATANPAQYSSPYVVNFTYPLSSLQQDFDSAPRNSVAGESSKPFGDWYILDTYIDPETNQVSTIAQVYGPPAAQFPDNGYESMPVQWQRERVLATALRYQNVMENLPYDGTGKFGISYRHHHIPAFDPTPSENWPPLEVNGATPIPATGHGMDCSNFTSWCYNYGLSLQFTSDVGDQGALTSISNYGGVATPQLPVEKIVPAAGATIPEIAALLETGDLLYIENSETQVVHTVMWVGDLGGVDTSKLNAEGQALYTEDQTVYLIIDSTSDARTDINGNQIPDGPHLREFRDWYYTNLSHANRYLGADPSDNVTAQLLGGILSENDWYGSSWFGWFYSSTTDLPWIYHLQLGWMAAYLTTTNNIWFYHTQLGWLWTSQSLFPYLYSNDAGAWLWLDESSTNPVQLWNLSSGTSLAVN